MLFSTRMPAKKITCPKCSGCGKVELSPALQAAFDAIPVRNSCDASFVAGKIGTSRPAATMRLLDLIWMDAVERNVIGGEWLYSRK